jgi:3-oxoacyl-[acyl-carrier protein] reductase
LHKRDERPPSVDSQKRRTTMNQRLTGKVALVTGGSRGIGAAIAKRLAREGATVAVTYAAGKGKADEVVRAIETEGGRASAILADSADAQAVKRAVAETAKTFGRLDILVNNAGIWEEDLAGRGDLAVWDRTYAVNLRGSFLVTDAAVRHLAERGGAIVLVSSTAGQRGEAGHSAYAASKGALISYAKSLAVELGPRGIRVNCIAPGWVDTDMTVSALGEPAARQAIEGTIPLGRVASPEDIAGPILFLVSELARHVQGEVLNVNGGSVLIG